MGGGGGGWVVLPTASFYQKKTHEVVRMIGAWWLALRHGCEFLAPHGCCPSCWRANHLTTPLFQRGKWVGVGPLITSSGEHRLPWGMRRVTLLSSLNKIFICYFFPSWLDNSIPTQGGEHAHHLSAAELAEMCPSLQVKLKGVQPVHQPIHSHWESFKLHASLDCGKIWRS